MKLNEKYLTVTALTKYIKKKMELDPHLRNVLLKGEISNFNHHNRGHMYLTIKDDQSRIQAVMFQGNNRHLKFTPENGMQVLIQGDINVFEPYGQYQLYIKSMEPDGIGSLYLAFEQLKERLSKQGYFNEEHKRHIPTYPTHIGVITSPTGAAVRDIITTIKRRNPNVTITIIPAIVQGIEAIDSIINAIEIANRLHHFDVLIVGRGGGSIEDLWVFNEEAVVKAIFHSKIPIISAIGHETDVTISDFVADLRASTPTGAGELAVVKLTDMMANNNLLKERLTKAYKLQLLKKNEIFSPFKKAYAFYLPQQLIHKNEQYVDRLQNTLIKNITSIQQHNNYKFSSLQTQLAINHPRRNMEILSNKLNSLERTFTKSVYSIIQKKETKLLNIMDKLMLLNPLEIIKRGYALPFKNQEIIKTIEQINITDHISIKIADGNIDCEVKEIWKDGNNGTKR